MPGRRRIIRSPPDSPPIVPAAEPAAVPADPAPVIVLSDGDEAPAQPSQPAAGAHPPATASSALLQDLSDSDSGSSSWVDELEEAEQQSLTAPVQTPHNLAQLMPKAPYRWVNPNDEVAWKALEAQAFAPGVSIGETIGFVTTMVALMTANAQAISQEAERSAAASKRQKKKLRAAAAKQNASAAAAAAQEVYSVAAAEVESPVAAAEAEAPAATEAEAAAEADAKAEAAAEAAAAAKSRLRAARAAKAAKRAADADAAAAAAARDDAALAEAAQQRALDDDIQVPEHGSPVEAVRAEHAAAATTPLSPTQAAAQARVPAVPAVKVNTYPPPLPSLPVPVPQMTFKRSGAEEMHQARLQELVAHGWQRQEAAAALASTAVDGLESTEAANDHLIRTSQTPLREAVAHLRRLNAAATRHTLASPAAAAPHNDDAIAPDSHLGQFISLHPECVVAGIYLRNKHRAGIHTGRPGSNVANLLGSAAGYVSQLTADIALKPNPYRVEDLAAAICADCSICNAQCYADAARRDVHAATQAAAAPAPAPATTTMPAPTPFSARASARDRRLPVTECNKCGIGQLPGGAGKTCLYFCSPCGRGWHKKCAQLTHISDGIHDDGHWACPECLQEHSRRQEHGQPPSPLPQRPTPLRDPASRILFAYDPSQAEPDALNQFEGVGPLLRHYGRQQDAHRMHQQQILHRQARLEATPINDGLRTPMPTSGGGAAGGWGEGLYPTPGGFQPLSPQSALGDVTGGNITKTQVKIENYYQWPKLPSVATADDLRTKGNSKEAYLNWKEINIPRRDQAKSNGGDLGPLAKNAFTPLMKLDVASSIVDDKRVQPEPNMSKEALARWINGDPLFSWFEFLPDKLLLEVLDSKHKVANPDGLFRRRMAPIPQMVANELNYAPDKFGAFCGEWIAEYSELVVSGWNPASIDCKALFLEAIDGHTLVANEAKRCSETNVILLIAHLRTWVQAKFTDTQNAIKEREAAAKSAGTSKPTPSLTESKAAKALLSRVDALEKAKKQDPTDPKVWMCDGCGNSYSDTSKARKPPCRPKCVYFEHVGFNKTKKPWDPALTPLTWKQYPHEYPASFQAYCDKRDAKKRSARGDAAPPQKKQHTTA